MAVQAPALPAQVEPRAAAVASSGYIHVVAVFVFTRLALYAIGWLAAIVVPIDVRLKSLDPRLGAYWLEVWARGDVSSYLGIAADGYRVATPERFALFPLYPMLLSLARLAGANTYLVGVAVANIAFLVALLLLFRLTRARFGDDATAQRAVCYLAVYPGTVFTLTAYADALFLAMSLASFLLLVRQRWAPSAVFGGLAVAARLAGVAVAVAWLAEFISWHGRERQKLSPALVTVLLIPAGLGCASLALYLFVGNPLAYLLPAAWNGTPVPVAPWEAVQRALQVAGGQHLAVGFEERYAINIVNLGVAVVFLLLLPLVFVRVGFAFGVYTLLGLLAPLLFTPLSDRPLQGVIPAGLGLFPVFMLLADLGRRPVVDRLIVGVSVLFLGLLTTLFVSGWYVG